MLTTDALPPLRKRYRRLEAWGACHELLLAVYRATQGWPASERYGLTAQARRASFSAAANIVEGSSRGTPRQFRSFLDVSLGSIGELDYVLVVARDLGLLGAAAYGELESVRDRAGKLTWGLYCAVKKRAERS